MSLPFTAELLTEKLVVARGSLQLNASFMLPIFLRLALQAGQHVVLVVVQQTAAHYKQVLRKLGVILDSYITNGRLTIIDLLTDSELIAASDSLCVVPPINDGEGQALSAAGAKIISTMIAAENSAAEPPPSQHSGHPCQQNKPTAASNAATPSQVVVMFDALSQLCSLSSSHAEWSAFLRRLASRCCRMSDGRGLGVCIFAVLNADELDLATEEHIVSAASLIVNLFPLAAGQSVDVSGRVEVLLRECHSEMPWAGREEMCRNFYYKSTDSTLRFLQFYDAA